MPTPAQGFAAARARLEAESGGAPTRFFVFAPNRNMPDLNLPVRVQGVPVSVTAGGQRSVSYGAVFDEVVDGQYRGVGVSVTPGDGWLPE